VEFPHDPWQFYMDLFWNKQLFILKLCIIFVVVLPKFFYSNTWNTKVLQRFLVLIHLKINKKISTVIKILVLGSSTLAFLPSFLAEFGEF
jgi:hypothetical protein